MSFLKYNEYHSFSTHRFLFFYYFYGHAYSSQFPSLKWIRSNIINIILFLSISSLKWVHSNIINIILFLWISSSKWIAQIICTIFSISSLKQSFPYNDIIIFNFFFLEFAYTDCLTSIRPFKVFPQNKFTSS